MPGFADTHTNYSFYTYSNPVSTHHMLMRNIMADPDGLFAAGIQVGVLWYWVNVRAMLLNGDMRPS